jgi:hypothetical protein
LEDLATPDADWLSPVEGARQARWQRRAVGAQRLGEFEVGRSVREPEVGIMHLTRQVVRGASVRI